MSTLSANSCTNLRAALANEENGMSEVSSLGRSFLHEQVIASYHLRTFVDKAHAALIVPKCLQERILIRRPVIRCPTRIIHRVEYNNRFVGIV
jgi:hypothetical protein